MDQERLRNLRVLLISSAVPVGCGIEFSLDNSERTRKITNSFCIIQGCSLVVFTTHFPNWSFRCGINAQVVAGFVCLVEYSRSHIYRAQTRVLDNPCTPRDDHLPNSEFGFCSSAHNS